MEKKYQIILILLLFIFLTFISFLFSPFFHIREFVVHSRNEINKNDLRTHIRQFYGENLLFLNEERLKDELLNHNLISAVQIKKSFPSTVHIVIEERTAVGWLKNNGKKLIFSADGIILTEKAAEAAVSIPEFEGFSYYFKKDKIIFPQLVNELLKDFSDLNKDYLAEIKKITYKNNSFKLYLTAGGGVNLGDNNNLEKKLAILNSILKNNKEEQIDYINLEVSKHPVIKLK